MKIARKSPKSRGMGMTNRQMKKRVGEIKNRRDKTIGVPGPKAVKQQRRDAGKLAVQPQKKPEMKPFSERVKQPTARKAGKNVYTPGKKAERPVSTSKPMNSLRAKKPMDSARKNLGSTMSDTSKVGTIKPVSRDRSDAIRKRKMASGIKKQHPTLALGRTGAYKKKRPVRRAKRIGL